MASAATPPLLHRIPRSITAPDAWIALLLASYLQYKQYARRQQNNGKGKIHAGAKAKPKRHAARSFVHECIFTRLHMMVSPYANQASELNADMVDLQNDEDLGAYADKVASGKAPKKKKQPKSGGSGGEEMMEVRSRRIVTGEMVHNAYFPMVETSFNLALAMLVGLASRWVLGLIRSLRLSLAPGGPCCSPYRGGDDAGTRMPGAFERLLACVLVKQEADHAGTLLFSLVLLLMLGGIVRLAWSVSSPSAAKNDDLADASDADAGGKAQETDAPTYRRIHPRKVKRFFVGVGATLSSLMLSHTPALLRMLGLDGLTEAVEELTVRLMLFGHLLGVATLPETSTLEHPSDLIHNGLLVAMAITWGIIAAGMMTPIDETARNAAHVLSPAPNKGTKRSNPNEMLELINVRMMLVIQAMAPFVIMCTYLTSTRFAETTKPMHGGGDVKMTFSKQYLSNSGLFVRVALSWCFLGASLYTFRSLLQSFLDQASTVASGMAMLGEGVAGSAGATAGRGGRNKRSATPTAPPPTPPKRDPFNERYSTLVMTAGRIAVFPAFVFGMLAVAHIRGGVGSTHPGVGHESLPKDAPRSALLPVRGLLPPYANPYMTWMAKQNNSQNGQAGDALLHTAALSQSMWETAPVRDSAHKKVASWGRNRLCYPPEVRSVKAMGRHVNYLLDHDENEEEEGSLLTLNPFTGRELFDMAPRLPVTLADILSGKAPVSRAILEEATLCKNDGDDEVEGEEDSKNSQESKECKAEASSAQPMQYPGLSEMMSFIASHTFLTPTIVFPIIDTFAFMSSVLWNYWYTVRMLVYWVRLRGAASSLRITA